MTGRIDATHPRPLKDRHTTRNLAQVRPVVVPLSGRRTIESKLPDLANVRVPLGGVAIRFKGVGAEGAEARQLMRSQADAGDRRRIRALPARPESTDKVGAHDLSANNDYIRGQRQHDRV